MCSADGMLMECYCHIDDFIALLLVSHCISVLSALLTMADVKSRVGWKTNLLEHFHYHSSGKHFFRLLKCSLHLEKNWNHYQKGSLGHPKWFFFCIASNPDWFVVSTHCRLPIIWISLLHSPIAFWMVNEVWQSPEKLMLKSSIKTPEGKRQKESCFLVRGV